jgi:ATP phosphoribosyltransferase regulatory subunit HisZ
MIFSINTRTAAELSQAGLELLGTAQTQADAVEVAQEALGEEFLGVVTLQRLEKAGRNHYAVWVETKKH